MKTKKSKKLLSLLMAVVMTLSLVPGTVIAAEAAPDKHGTATVTMKHESKDQNSMCDPMFDAKADISVTDGMAAVKLLVANPVPGFPDQGADGTVKNVKVTYDGKQYDAVSELGTDAMMTAKAKNDLFGLTAGEQYPAQVLTITLPEAAIVEGALLKTDAYVNVVMMTDVVFRMELTELVWDAVAPVAPATPVVTPTNYDLAVNEEVTITTETAGADIYYTTDGTDPTAETGVKYAGPFTLAIGRFTVKAIAVKDGVSSEIASKSYGVGPIDPVITPASGTVLSDTNNTITITSPTEGGKIYYTLDGSQVGTYHSHEYTGPFQLSAGCTVKAIAVQGNMASREVQVNYGYEYATTSHGEADAATMTVGDTTYYFADSASALLAVCDVVTWPVDQPRTLKLLKDVTEWNSSVVIPSDTTFTLDLNGHNMTTTQSGVCVQTGKYGTNLTVTDTSAGDVKGTITTVPDHMMTAAVKFGQPDYGAAAESIGSLTINNGVTLMDGVTAYYGNVTIDGATINGNLDIWGDSVGKNTVAADIKNSTINSAHMWNAAIGLVCADATLTNCTATSTSGPVFQADSGLTIESGTYSSDGAAIASYANFTVNGGTFKSASGEDYAGTFEGCVLTLPEGKKMVWNTDHWELGDIVITDNGALTVTPANGTATAYTKVLDAIAAANAAGGTIQLTGDSSVSGYKDFVISNDVVLDLNGHTLTVAPEAMFNNASNGAINVDQGGKLTIRDSSADKAGVLDMNSRTVGIAPRGTDACITIESGTIDATNIGYGAITRNSWDVTFDLAYTGTVLMTGGLIKASGMTAIIMAASEMDGAPHGSVILSGGEILCSGTASGVSVSSIDLEIKDNAKITAPGGSAVSVNASSVDTAKGVISGDAVLTAGGYNAISVGESAAVTLTGNARVDYTGTHYAANVVGGTFTVEGTSKVSSTGTSVLFGHSEGIININDGLFKLGNATMFVADFSDEWTKGLKEVNYKADDTYTGSDPNVGFYILSSEADENGYHGLVKRQDVKQTNSLGQEVGYQNFELLQSAVDSANSLIANEGTGDAAYTAPSKQAVTDALTQIAQYLNKPNTSQYEIDLLTAKLNKAIAGLQTVGAVDPTQLADGVYTVTVKGMRSGTDDASMAAGALEPNATLVIKNGHKELHVGFQPIFLMGLHGHLVRLWEYDGASAAESLELAKSSDWEKHLMRCEAFEYYTTTQEEPLVKVLSPFDPSYDYDAEGVFAPTHFPGKFVLPLSYVNSAKGEDRYICRVSVDAMNGLGAAGTTNEQDLDIQVMWGTAKAAEYDALLLDTNKVTLAAGESQTVNASMVTAGLPIAWTSGNANVATVENGVITAVGAGSTKIAVVAEGFDESYTRVIDVTVTGPAKPAVSAASAALRAEKEANADGTAPFVLSLTDAENIAVLEVSYDSKDAVTVEGLNGFSVVGVKNNVATLVYTAAGQLSADGAVDVVRFNVAASGDTTMRVTDLVIAGRDANETAIYGKITGAIDPNEATFIRNIYDLNKDEVVDLLDLVVAQKFYQATAESDVWADAVKCDFNADGVVDITDYIDLYNHFTQA